MTQIEQNYRGRSEVVLHDAVYLGIVHYTSGARQKLAHMCRSADPHVKAAVNATCTAKRKMSL